MSVFKVHLHPSPPAASRLFSRFDLQTIDIEATLESNDQVYDIEFELNGSRFGYSAENIVLTMASLADNIEQLRTSTPHNLTIHDYPVLPVRFVGSEVVFLDPMPIAAGTPPRELARVAVDEAIQELLALASAVWGQLCLIREPSASKQAS